MNKSILSLVFKPNVTPNIPSQTAWAIFRMVVGLMMIHNGLDKLGNIESFAEAYVSYIGLPFPIFFSYVAAFTELIGAPLVAIGLFTRPAALGLFSTMLVAMYHHILVAGFSVAYLELSAIYAVCFLFFLINGAGLFSTDALILNLLDNQALTQKAKQIMLLEKSYQASSDKKEAQVR
ncbi:DoxX family protein [Crocosphaera watsonii WH 8501]|uniref:Surfeit locus 4-related n=3 Tax=Crocosphaera watsonii TaxID=263511 RepID=Q4BVD4_CROWT|nr:MULTISPECIES: DoxX family protein [Crocosphaera]EAM47867.1 Surfeit locus 4-related [Crocosphaera watsonii WH 8501]NQZ62100.1 DoxX family protein [Crocosphaera sp.]CCQ49770.1 DoxX family protein [Crocosphaera watsonii WH 8502]CCQ64438.1 DoxX family protein [Crocosphaera watsonii WH 0401]